MMVLELLEYYRLNVDGTQTQYSSTTILNVVVLELYIDLLFLMLIVLEIGT